jgi:ADP-ribosylglycohydrolase
VSEAPFPGTFWVLPGRLLAGEHPAERVAALLALGVDYFLDLTWPAELPDYDVRLPRPYAAGELRKVIYSRRPIRDHSIPADAAQMLEVLDELDDALARGHRVYVHCRAGIGRTGLVIGCFLARRTGSGQAALAELDRLWQAGGRRTDWPRSPETDEQHAFVHAWREAARELPRAAEPLGAAPDRLQDRYRGLLLGLAVGEALGVPVLHRRAGSFTPVADLLGGGPYELPRGAWADLTAQSLVLAESVLQSSDFEPRDASRRLQRWQREGHLSSTGQCVGISATTARALALAHWTSQPFAGSHDPAHAEAEPMARAGVAAGWGAADAERALELAVDFARLTHQAPLALDATRYYAALLVGALGGREREALLAPDFTPVPGLWERRPLKPQVAAVAADAVRRATGARPPANARAVDALALAMWAIARHGTWRESVLAVVNLGLNASTHGALVGQLAGALYGASAIPAPWRAAIAQRELIETTAERLLAAALTRSAAV